MGDRIRAGVYGISLFREHESHPECRLLEYGGYGPGAFGHPGDTDLHRPAQPQEIRSAELTTAAGTRRASAPDS